MGPRHSARAYIITTKTAHNPPSVRRGGEDGPPIRRTNPNARPLRLPLRVVPGHWQPCFGAGLRAPTPGTRFGQVTPFCHVDLSDCQWICPGLAHYSGCGNQFGLSMDHLRLSGTVFASGHVHGGSGPWRTYLNRGFMRPTIDSGSGSKPHDAQTSFSPDWA